MLGLNLGINKGIAKNKYRTLEKSCGMLTGTTDLETDRVGVTSRTAVRGVKIIGNGNTYIKNINLANQALVYVDSTTLLEVNANFDSDGEFLIPINGINGLTTDNYTLDTTNRNNEYILIPDDNSEPIVCQQFLSPAQPTQENIEVVSLADSYGYTIADGTQYYDVAGTKQIPIASIIPNYPDGITSTAYVDGVHPKGTFLGRCKYDFTSDGTIIQLADNYHEIAKYDTTRILTEVDGTPKILTLENIALVTNNQLYYNQDLKIGFFKESLTGDCHEKANKMFEQRIERLSDSDLVQLSDSEGEKLYSLV